MPGKAPLSGDDALDLGLCPRVLQHNPLRGVPYPIHKLSKFKIALDWESQLRILAAEITTSCRAGMSAFHNIGNLLHLSMTFVVIASSLTSVEHP